jgi:hypothetical protein
VLVTADVNKINIRWDSADQLLTTEEVAQRGLPDFAFVFRRDEPSKQRTYTLRDELFNKVQLSGGWS